MFPNNVKLHSGAIAAVQEVCCGPPPDDPRNISHSPNLQALAYSRLLTSAFFQNSLHRTIFKRISHLFKPYNLEGGCCSSRLGYVIMHRSMRKYEAMRIIKTWCSSWATSSRMHEDKMCSGLAFTDKTIRKRICHLFKPYSLEGGGC